MKITNIQDLKKDINKSTILAFIFIFSSALIGLYFTHHNFIKNQCYLDQHKIMSAENVFKSNLSEKLSIIASSSVFIDYLRSGDKTRKHSTIQFLSQLSTLKSKSIAGMKIIDLTNNQIFESGAMSNLFLDLKLCYLNQTLDAVRGECNYIWRLYFKPSHLLTEFLAIDHEMQMSSKGVLYNLFSGRYFGSFPIQASSGFSIKLAIKNKNDYLFYPYLALITFTLLTFGAWSLYRSSKLLNKYIANPINSLTECLKSNDMAPLHNHIAEIQFLINEINSWKNKLNKTEADKNAAKLGKIAAQLAHDVRSPLSAINLLVKALDNIPENKKLVLRQATQRIDDIANNFLSQYSTPFYDEKTKITNQHVPSLLESIISEKRYQYADCHSRINLQIMSYDVFALINPIDFKRVISNLINNAVEAIKNHGEVNVTLIKTDPFFKISIVDNGCGIPPHLLPKIRHGGISIGKKNGSGLGLSHAIKTIKDWHGSIDIESHEGKGTHIQIELPLSEQTPQWFALSLSLPPNGDICIVDDDKEVHELWKHRLQSFILSNAPSRLHHFMSATDFCHFMQHGIRSHFNDYFLIDYELGQHEAHGITLIEQFKLEQRAVLVTNRYDDVYIQQHCESLGIRIIPKNYVVHIPIQVYSLLEKTNTNGTTYTN